MDLTRFHGQFELLHIEIDHNNYAKLRAILIERYGRPTKADTSTVTSNGGVTLPAETSEWIGSTNSLRLFERFGSINKSLAAFTNNELSQKAGQKILDKVKDCASKF